MALRHRLNIGVRTCDLGVDLPCDPTKRPPTVRSSDRWRAHGACLQGKRHCVSAVLHCPCKS